MCKHGIIILLVAMIGPLACQSGNTNTMNDLPSPVTGTASAPYYEKVFTGVIRDDAGLVLQECHSILGKAPATFALLPEGDLVPPFVAAPRVYRPGRTYLVMVTRQDGPDGIIEVRDLDRQPNDPIVKIPDGDVASAIPAVDWTNLTQEAFEKWLAVVQRLVSERKVSFADLVGRCGRPSHYSEVVPRATAYFMLKPSLWPPGPAGTFPRLEAEMDGATITTFRVVHCGKGPTTIFWPVSCR